MVLFSRSADAKCGSGLSQRPQTLTQKSNDNIGVWWTTALVGTNCYFQGGQPTGPGVVLGWAAGRTAWTARDLWCVNCVDLVRHDCHLANREELFWSANSSAAGVGHWGARISRSAKMVFLGRDYL
jgi:hypothetical protein